MRSAEGSAAGVGAVELIDDAGDWQQSIFQPTTLGEDQAKNFGELMDDRQVVKDGQIVFGAKPPKLNPWDDPQTSTSTTVSGSASWNKLYSLLKGQLGTPYVWGGENPGGFDCSGLVQWVFGKMGIRMPRLSYDQMAKGRPVSLNKLRPGDLIGYHNGPGGRADHIAIYIGNGRIIEAPRPGRYVQVGRVHDTPGAFAVRILN